MDAKPDLPVQAFVVWEPVLPTDWFAPSTRALRRLSDPRARQYWDKGRRVSKAMGEKDNESIVWDVVAVYPPGVLWSDAAPPQPLFLEGPIVDVIPGLTAALSRAMVKTAPR